MIERKLRKTGIPLSEMTRNVGEKPQRKPVWIPAEQKAMIDLLTDIRDALLRIEKKK